MRSCTATSVRVYSIYSEIMLCKNYAMLPKSKSAGQQPAKHSKQPQHFGTLYDVQSQSYRANASTCSPDLTDAARPCKASGWQCLDIHYSKYVAAALAAHVCLKHLHTSDSCSSCCQDHVHRNMFLWVSCSGYTSC